MLAPHDTGVHVGFKSLSYCLAWQSPILKDMGIPGLHCDTGIRSEPKGYLDSLGRVYLFGLILGSLPNDFNLSSNSGILLVFELFLPKSSLSRG